MDACWFVCPVVRLRYLFVLAFRSSIWPPQLYYLNISKIITNIGVQTIFSPTNNNFHKFIEYLNQQHDTLMVSLANILDYYYLAVWFTGEYSKISTCNVRKVYFQYVIGQDIKYCGTVMHVIFKTLWVPM